MTSARLQGEGRSRYCDVGEGGQAEFRLLYRPHALHVHILYAAGCCVAVVAAERDYDLQFWKEELIREINELEKSATELAVRTHHR